MTIKTGGSHTNSPLCAGICCFVRLPLYKHSWLPLSSLIDWFISALMPEIESTPLSAAGTQGLAECTDCVLSTAVFVCIFTMRVCKGSPIATLRWMQKKQNKTTTKNPKEDEIRFLFPHPPSFFPRPLPSFSALPRSPIPHPLRGAREHAVEKTEPIKTLPESIHSLRLT